MSPRSHVLTLRGQLARMGLRSSCEEQKRRNFGHCRPPIENPEIAEFWILVLRCVGQPMIIFSWLAPGRHPENPEIAEFWILVVRCVGQPMIIFSWLAPRRQPENPEIAEFWILGRRFLLAGSGEAP